VVRHLFPLVGIYTQGDGVGAIGGKNGEGKATRNFMVRIRIPNGALEAHQLRTIADLAEWHGGGIGDITVRQNIQLHWVKLESLPGVFRALWLQGVTTLGACGDVTRNVTGCPLAGRRRRRARGCLAARPCGTQMLNGNPAFYNLPRKFKSRSRAAAPGARIPNQRRRLDGGASPGDG